MKDEEVLHEDSERDGSAREPDAWFDGDDDTPLTPAEEDQLDDLLDEMEERLKDDPPQRLSRIGSVEPAGTLVAHCGTRKITRKELAQIPAPPPTRTHQPVAHSRIVEVLTETLAFRRIHVVREEYALSRDGARMFGVMDLDYEDDSLEAFRFSIGIRNSNDKRMRLGMTAGYRVFVCDNMAFQGDFMPVFAKHTHRLDLVEIIAIGVDRVQRNFAPLKARIEAWQREELSDTTAKLLIYEAFVEGRLKLPRHLMHRVHRYYFNPEYVAFRGRSLWSLSNAFTSAFKFLTPVGQFQATAKLGSFLNENHPRELPVREGQEMTGQLSIAV
jgi:hypothetical protein